jgi:hypothetical protein
MSASIGAGATPVGVGGHARGLELHSRLLDGRDLILPQRAGDVPEFPEIQQKHQLDRCR